VNRLREEMKVIPRVTWFIAAVPPLLFVLGCVFFLVAFQSPTSGPPPLMTAWLAFVGTMISVSLFVFILMVGYISGDARRRGMRWVLWTLLAIFIPNAIGILLYFILREPLLRQCPRCGTGTKAAFPYCPSCGANLAGTCPSCQSAIEPEWTHCARCGAKLSSRSDPKPSPA
jgi:hypothetical protein